jgi:hypothetical protein
MLKAILDTLAALPPNPPSPTLNPLHPVSLVHSAFKHRPRRHRPYRRHFPSTSVQNAFKRSTCKLEPLPDSPQNCGDVAKDSSPRWVADRRCASVGHHPRRARI